MLTIKVFNYQTGEFQETTLTPETTITGECIIGRAANSDLILSSPEVSRVHGRIIFQQAEYYFSDLGSTDGSRINNEEAKVNQRYSLKKDDVIRIGEFVLLITAVETPPLLLDTLPGLKSDRLWTKGDLRLRCIQIIAETTDVKTFRFVAEPPILFTYQPGQFVTLDLEINGESVVRSYSISSTPSRPHTLEITVKRVPSPLEDFNVPPGLVSNWLHDDITVGSKVKLCGGPIGQFSCVDETGKPKKLLMISAGSGITPMMSMLRWVYDTAAEYDIVFFHSARSPREIIFRQELELIAARLPNFRLAITTTQVELGEIWLGWTGRLTEPMLLSVAPDLQERTVYVCGSDGFMQAAKAMLLNLAFPMQNYYEESFGVEPNSKTAVDNSAPLVNKQLVETDLIISPIAVFFAESGQEVGCNGDRSILEVAEQQGIKIRSSCKQGICGACKKQKLEGEVKYQVVPHALDDSEQQAGLILTCVAHPVGRVVIAA